ncbi:MAG: hypothetical protein QF442_03355 [Candidatus Peribacteraceae bacterium]|jgi:DNA polymerase-3 subunit delta'|nr:hypothetical protein [Candidatus Peribacteraceae bacterium]
MPKLVEKIIGHVSQQEQLQEDIQSENVSHAYLFSGPRHLGKLSIALRYARELLSADVSSIEKLTHPDLYMLDQLWMEEVCEDWDQIAKTSNIIQTHRSKAPKAKTDIISIDDIRSLQDRLVETGTGKYRCCIIRSVERMKDAAANAFLKILEEPPKGLVFLLTTQAQESLLPTIVSRTRVVPFRRVAPKDVRIILEGVSEDDVKFILHIARGALGIAVALRDDPDLLRLHRTIHGTAQSFWRSQSAAERMQILSVISKRGEEAEDLLLHIGLALRLQPDRVLEAKAPAYHRLMEGLQTNAHRQLLVQRFALEVDRG